jgi:hypothetical protein
MDSDRNKRRHVRDKAVIDHLADKVFEPSAAPHTEQQRPITDTGLSVEQQVQKKSISVNLSRPIARLKEIWFDEHQHWRKRDLSAKRYVYVWADGIYLQARLEDAKQCILVIIGATPEGKKELLGFTDGARESAQDWRELLLDLKNRGLVIGA